MPAPYPYFNPNDYRAGGRLSSSPGMLLTIDGRRTDMTASPQFFADRAAAERAAQQRAEDIRRRHNRLVSIFGATGAGIAGAGAALGALGAGGAGAGMAGGKAAGTTGALGQAAGAATGASGPLATAGSAAATGGRLANWGRIFNSPGMELGVNAGLNLLGMRSQSNAANQARADMLAQQREALALERQRLELEARNADLDREDARRLNDAINALKERELAAMEEERAYRRSQDEAREARMGPYRETSLAANDRLRAMWGI